MTRFADVWGQDVATAVLERAIEMDRVASAYLFEGPSGVGKQRAALALARAVVGGDAHVQERIAHGAHPDVRIFAPRDDKSRNLKVDFIREEVLPVAQFAPFEAQAAFLIFPEADVSFPSNHPEAANALLKTLEEPRPRVSFVLLAERPDRLLPTIRSRCQRLRFAPLRHEILDRILAERGVEDSLRGPAIALARGRADRAIELAGEGRAEQLFVRALEVHDATMTSRPGLLVQTAERLAKLEERDRTLELEALSLLYRDLAALDAGAPDSALAFRSHASDLEERARGLGASAAVERERLVREVEEALARNANQQSTFDALLFELRRFR